MVNGCGRAPLRGLSSGLLVVLFAIANRDLVADDAFAPPISNSQPWVQPRDLVSDSLLAQVAPPAPSESYESQRINPQPVSAAPPAANVCGNPGCPSPWIPSDPARWWDNLELFGGFEGSKQPQDFGTNAQFGGRVSANLGIPLFAEAGIGLQVGTSGNFTDNAVQVFDRVEGNRSRVQNYSTVGVFQRAPSGLVWALVYDFLYEDYYDTFFLGQWRATLGYQFTQCDEIGAWGTVAQQSDHGNFGPGPAVPAIPVELRPIDQASLFWRHTWDNYAQTTIWCGGCPGHGQVDVALGDLPRTGPCVVFGADVHIPLNDHWALFGEANFLTPCDSGTVDAYLGFCYYIDGTARGFRMRQWAPVLPVANNTSFATDLLR
jgi:uncharacterized protein DUF6666